VPKFSDAGPQDAASERRSAGNAFRADDALVQFRAAARARGIELPPEIEDDGEIHRCDTTGRHGDGDAAYLLHHLDGGSIPAGGFQNWQDGLGWQNWHANIKRDFTPAENAELRRKREADKAKREADKAKRRANIASDIADILSRTVPLAGTLGEVYLRARGITRMPISDDVRFNGDTTHWKTKSSKPAIIARFRYPDGTNAESIHRLYLKEDGSGHIGQEPDATPPGKMMLNPVKHALVMLDQIGMDGNLAIGEGIETGCAVRQLFEVPYWAAGSADGIVGFGEWLLANRDAEVTRSIKRLLICADAGQTGIDAGQKLLAIAVELGFPDAEVWRPRGDDDFLADLVAGLPRPDAPIAWIENGRIVPQGMGPPQEILPSLDDIKEAVSELPKGDPDAIGRVITRIATAAFGKLWDDQLLDLIREKTGAKIGTLREALAQARKLLEAAKQPNLPQVRDPANWRAGLILNKDKEPKPLLANICEAIGSDATWKGVVALNEFTGMITMLAKPPWPGSFREERAWTDADTRVATWWVQTVAEIPAQSYMVFEGVTTIAEHNTFHPVRNYLDPLIHDGVPRIDDLFVTYFGAGGDQPDESESEEALKEWNRRYNYLQAVGARSLIGAIARIYDPGCKNDCSPTLVGDQGELKSSAIKALFEPWFTDEISDFGSKDAAMQTAGVWGIEIGELVAARRDVDRTKAFMSRSTDRFRPPYGKLVIEQPRQCVFWGTTNRDTFLFDETGNRRSWSVRNGRIDIDALRRDKDQLWAEARDRYRRGEKWWLHEPELIAVAAEVQAEFMEEEVWEAEVLTYLNGPAISSTAVDEVLKHLGVEVRDRTKVHSNTVTRILRKAGWVRRRGPRPGRLWRWFHRDPGTTTI
jgi:predicted P-loop ATPase